jgi:hypothetical protein
MPNPICDVHSAFVHPYFSLVKSSIKISRVLGDVFKYMQPG